MAINKKLIAVLIIIGFVVLIGGYLAVRGIIAASPERTETAADAKIMADSIADYNERFGEYSTAYTALARHTNSMTSDNQVTLAELEGYETLLGDFISSCDAVIEQSESTKDLVVEYKEKFNQTDYNRIISEFNLKEDAIRNDMNTVVIGINMIRGANTDPEQDQILNDLSVQLIEIRDR